LVQIRTAARPCGERTAAAGAVVFVVMLLLLLLLLVFCWWRVKPSCITLLSMFWFFCMSSSPEDAVGGLLGQPCFEQ